MVTVHAPSPDSSTLRTMPRSTTEMTGISGSDTSDSQAHTCAADGTAACGAAWACVASSACGASAWTATLELSGAASFAAFMALALSRLPLRARIGALQELHFGQDVTQVLG